MAILDYWSQTAIWLSNVFLGDLQTEQSECCLRTAQDWQIKDAYYAPGSEVFRFTSHPAYLILLHKMEINIRLLQ